MKQVVVFGGANVDVIARPHARLRPGVSNPGSVYVGAGGAGRNVATNLARLGAAADLVAAVGTDAAGEYLIAETARAGVGVARMLRVGNRSNYYVAVVGAGPERLAVSDMAAAEALPPSHVEAAADLARKADMVVIDANLHATTLAAALAVAASTPVCLLPTSPAKALRMSAVLHRASLIVAGAAELEVLSERPIESAHDALDAAQVMRSRTGATVIVSMGAMGVGLAGDEVLWLEALSVAVVDVTGAGDAAAAVAIFGRITGMSAVDTVALARAAGAMTVTIHGATHPALSLEALRAYA